MDNMEAIKEKIVPVLKRHNVLKAAIFGSLVKGELSSASDIDILVEIDEDKSLFDFIQLKIDLEDEVKRRVDLVEYSTIYPLFKERILKEQVPLL